MCISLCSLSLAHADNGRALWTPLHCTDSRRSIQPLPIPSPQHYRLTDCLKEIPFVCRMSVVVGVVFSFVLHFVLLLLLLLRYFRLYLCWGLLCVRAGERTTRHNRLVRLAPATQFQSGFVSVIDRNQGYYHKTQTATTYKLLGCP